MAAYINRTDVMKICEGYSEHCFHSNDSRGQDIADRILDDIAGMNTADVVEVKHGEWIETGDRKLDVIYSGQKCSVCGYVYCGDKTNYCMNCGAKMCGGAE